MSDQCSQRLGVKATEGKAKASVHAVSCQLKGLLPDIILWEKIHQGLNAYSFYLNVLKQYDIGRDRKKKPNRQCYQKALKSGLGLYLLANRGQG